MKHRALATTLLAVFLLIIGMFSPGAVVLAQTSEGFQIKPAVVEDKVNPGETYTIAYTVTNVSETDREVYLDAQDIKGLSDQGLPIFAEEGEPTGYEMSDWVQLPGEPLFLKAHETRQVPIAIAVPSNASPGAHFGAIFVVAEPPRLRKTGSGVGISVGSVVTLRIAGEVTEEARLREFSTERYFYDKPPVDFMTRIENEGNVMLRPQGVIEITNMMGKSVGTVTVNDSGAPVFPMSQRDYKTTWEYDGFAIGKYEAVLSVVYGDEVRKTVSRSATFWVLPVKPILITLGVFLGLIFFMALFTKLYIRRKLRDMGLTTSSRGTAARYARRSASRMMIMVIGLFLIVCAFMVMFFLMFA